MLARGLTRLQLLLFGLLALTPPASSPAGPLRNNHVPASAKWILHVDLEDALRSQIGTLLAKEVVDRSLARPPNAGDPRSGHPVFPRPSRAKASR